MDAAHRIVFELVGPSTEASFLERLENRPDWQRYIGFVRTVIDDELFDANMRADGEQSRAEAAEAALASCNRARSAAEAECERLREDLAALTAELDTTRSLLQGVIDGPLMWYEDICDYLETIE